MIATGLTFLLGVLVTMLIVLLVAPIVWRKAQSLARRDYEATIPASANEIRAEFDAVRAAAALTVRQQEISAFEAREKAARAQAQLGRSTVENVEILKRNRNLLEIAEERAAEIARLTTTLATRDEENQTLSKTLAATRREAELSGQELASLASRFEDLGEIAEERKIQLVAAEAKLDRLADAQRVAERLGREQDATIERLRAEAAGLERAAARDRSALAQANERVTALLSGIAERDGEIEQLRAMAPARTVEAAARKEEAEPAASAPAPAAGIAASTPSDSRSEIQSAGQRLRAALAGKGATPLEPTRADIQDRISDIAAKVIQMTALAEGPQSPLGQILAAPREGGAAAAADDKGGVSLAERVRRIAEAEANKGAGGRSAQSLATRRE